MKVLTLHQPWASLVACGVKTIETRSWSTRYRGPLAIHAAAWAWDATDGNRHLVQALFDPERPGVYRNPATPPVPRGAIVATCTLVDVVPMTEARHYPPGGSDYMGPHLLLNGLSNKLWCWDGTGACDVEDQRPYGDFRPGRYAWLLAGITPLAEPVPFKGGQGLTKTWEPS